MAHIHLCLFAGEYFTNSSSFTAFFCNKKVCVVHSHIECIHVAITGECFFHSLHSREYIHLIMREWEIKTKNIRNVTKNRNQTAAGAVHYASWIARVGRTVWMWWVESNETEDGRIT